MRGVKIGIVLLCLAMTPSVGWGREKIRLASGEWMPYQSQQLKHAGFISRIVTEAFDLEGIEVEYGYFPWKRSFILAQKGEWDGTFLWFDNSERRETFFISDPVIDIQYVFFHLKDRPFDWKRLEDLEGRVIGATLGYDYGEVFQEADRLNILKINRAPSDRKNFELLLKNKIHIFPNDIEAGYALIRKVFPADQALLFTHHPLPLKAEPHHLLLSRKIKRNKKMLEIFNSGLKRLKENGRFDLYQTESRKGLYSAR